MFYRNKFIRFSVLTLLSAIVWSANETQANVLCLDAGDNSEVLYSYDDDGTRFNANYSSCFVVIEGFNYIVRDFDVLVTDTEKYSSVKRAKRRCRQFKEQSRNTHIREAFDYALANLSAEFAKATGGVAPYNSDLTINKTANPTYSCNRSGKRNNYAIKIFGHDVVYD